MRKLLLTVAVFALALPVQATNIITTVARADAYWDTLFSALQDGQTVWLAAGADYPVQCLSSHSVVPAHENGVNADAPADQLDIPPGHRDDYTSCADALGLAAAVRSANATFSWEVHTHRCQSQTCAFREWTLIGRFIHSGVEYIRARTTLPSGGFDTGGQWLDPDGNNAEGP